MENSHPSASIRATRGKSELTITPNSTTSQVTSAGDALESNYIKQYSMGFGETWSAVIPDVKGGVETAIGNKKDIISEVNPQYKDYIAQEPSYWGEQLFSGGPFYFGASIFVLFILGLIFITDPIKWAFLAASVLGVVLSWKYGNILQFFIDHFPLFNKFRDTKMMLILVQISFPFIGMLFVKEIMTTKINKKKLLYSLLIINGLLFLFYITPSTFFDFVSSSESDNFSSQISKLASKPEYQSQFNGFVSELENARIAIFKKDALRSLFYALAISALVYFFVAGKLKKNYLLGGIGILVLLDLWLVDKRILNNSEASGGYEMWVKSQQYKNPYRASVADNSILNYEIAQNPSLRNKIEEGVAKGMEKVKYQDTEIEKERLTFRELGFATDYRVLTLPDPFSNGEVSYFHKSLGGYNGAKLKKYQEIIDFYLSKELGAIGNSLKDSTATVDKITNFFKTGIPVFSMLNTKYIIYNQSAPPLFNPYINGNCWLVKDVLLAKNSDEEILSLGNVNLKTTAVINQKYKTEIPQIKFDSTATINLTTCLPNQLIYNSNAHSPQLAVFSEIYYPKGWNVYLDGKKSNYFSANYILRAMSIPSGAHTIEFRFEPTSYALGEKVSIASSIILIIVIIGFAISEGIRMRNKVA